MRTPHHIKVARQVATPLERKALKKIRSASSLLTLPLT